MSKMYMIIEERIDWGTPYQEPHSYKLYADEDKAQEVALKLMEECDDNQITYYVVALDVVG